MDNLEQHHTPSGQHFDSYAHLNEYSYDATNNSSSSMNENSLEYSASLDGKLPHTQSIGSEHMMFDGEGSFDMDPSLMLDEASNG